MKLTVILTGGKSRRMGRDKALLPLEGGTLLSALIGRYTGLFDAVAISVDQPGRFPTYGALELADRFPGQGPMAGLEAAFASTEAEYVFLTAIDLPRGDAELARALMARLEADPEADACAIRRQDGRYEPTFAVYRRSCLPHLQAALEAEERKFSQFYRRIRLLGLEEGDLPDFDLSSVLDNMNRPEDYERIVGR